MTVMTLETVVPHLFASAPEALPFAPSLEVRTFLLQRREGNLLLYSAGTLDDDAAAIEDLGGISRQYLNHRHEAMFGSDLLADTLVVPLFVHREERASVEERRRVRATFSQRHMLEGDFEVIPTPGHTSGATAYLWDSGDHRVLFTGDTVYLDDGEWVAAVLGSSDRAAYLQSLDLIRELDFGVLVPWAASHGQPFHAATDGADARRRIDAIIGRLRRGEDR